MKKLSLPEVTLVLVETREHELARLALEDCLKVAEFGGVLVVTDRPLEFSSLTLQGVTPRFHMVEDWPEKIGWSRSWWYDVPPLLRTRQTLNIQWDSWIWDPVMWRDEFLDYDYIGAPWWYTDGKNVGNGGFSLVSTRLKRYLFKHRAKFPCDTSIDDDLLCRKYRPQLEDAGFVWAPEKVAKDFAWEGCNQPQTQQTHFGFHAAFNFGLVLDKKRLEERARLMLKSSYISSSYIMKAFCQTNLELMQNILRQDGMMIEEPLASKEAVNG